MDGVRAAKLTAALFHLERRVWLLASALADLKLASGASLRSLQVRWIDQHERWPISEWWVEVSGEVPR